MRIGGRAALGLVAACLTMTACSGDPDDAAVTLPPATATASAPSPPPSSTDPPTETETAAPTPTTTLGLPDEHVESVDAFVADFFAALNAAKDTGDFSTYDAMYLPQCTGCIELRDELKGWLADGQSVEGGDWVVLQQSSDALPDLSRGGADAFAYRVAATASNSGASGSLSPQTTVQWFQFGLLPNGSAWMVEDMGYGNV